MKHRDLIRQTYQSTLGILVEIAYSFAIILTSIAVIYFVLFLKWSLNRL